MSGGQAWTRALSSLPAPVKIAYVSSQAHQLHLCTLGFGLPNPGIECTLTSQDLFQGKMYFLVVDAHSKWPEIFEMSVTTFTMTIGVLRHLFAQFGLSQQ